MPSTHAQPDTLYELQCLFGDLGPQVIVSHSGLTVPSSSLTMPNVAANGYVLSAGPPARLVYVSQPAVSITISATNGLWWLAVHADLHTPVAGWTRRSGSHYLTQQAATQPANPSGGLVWAQVTVAGGVITAVSPLTPVTSQPMSKQNSNAVAITGGRVVGLTPSGATPAVHVANVTGDGAVGVFSELQAAGGTNRFGFYASGNAPNALVGPLTCGTAFSGAQGQQVGVGYNRSLVHGIAIKPSADTGAYAVYFYNAAGTGVGAINTTSTATAYNTSSDHRLKEAVQTLTGALARIQALRPVSFRWQADSSPGIGFLAHEAQQVIPEAVTGVPDAVDEQGKIVPQQIDHSKLVPWLCAAVQEVAAQVQALTTRIHSLEEQLGI